MGVLEIRPIDWNPQEGCEVSDDGDFIVDCFLGLGIGIGNGKHVQRINFPVRHSHGAVTHSHMGREVICVGTKIPCKEFTIKANKSRPRKSYQVFYTTLGPTADIGSTGDLLLRQEGNRTAIYWKKVREDGITPVWREVGRNGLEIPHPLHPKMVLRGGACHPYPHWCQRPAGYLDEDDLYRAAREFFRVYGEGSSSRPIDLTIG